MGLFILLLIPLAIILGLLLPIIAIIAIVDILKSKFQGNDSILMILIVILIPFGAILYFVIAPSRKI